MNERIEARIWGDHHEELTSGMNGLFARIMDAFRVLHRIEWSAPWKSEAGFE